MVGTGGASLCYECSMDIVKNIADSEEVDIDQSKLVAYGI
jgi:hypothetical protein